LAATQLNPTSRDVIIVDKSRAQLRLASEVLKALHLPVPTLVNADLYTYEPSPLCRRLVSYAFCEGI
jgi:hypothetical protein